MSKYTKPRSCRTHDMVWGSACWNSTPNKTEFAKKFKVVPKTCTLSASKIEVYNKYRFLWTFWHNFPTNYYYLDFETTWDLFTKQDCIVAELWLAVPLTCRGSAPPTFWVLTRKHTFFWSRVYLANGLKTLVWERHKHVPLIFCSEVHVWYI